MRTWASWTAKTALLAVGFAAAGGGLSGVALAGSPGATATLPAARAPQTPASDPGSGNLAGSGNVLVGIGKHGQPSGQPPRGRLRQRGRDHRGA